ncbi:hypothetical protein B0H14DRAFT_3503096 [Mycena olivaceomarginata]|nr:hypothetical protein B0H14DRAFT_3503096 [Mycena olivaceomarginata]
MVHFISKPNTTIPPSTVAAMWAEAEENPKRSHPVVQATKSDPPKKPASNAKVAPSAASRSKKAEPGEEEEEEDELDDDEDKENSK